MESKFPYGRRRRHQEHYLEGSKEGEILVSLPLSCNVANLISFCFETTPSSTVRVQIQVQVQVAQS